MNSRPWVRVNRSWGWDKIEFRLARQAPDGRLHVLQPMLMMETERNIEIQPAFVMENDEAQLFLDELYRLGIRPTEEHGSVGALGATKDHLADLQKLIFEQRVK